MAKQERGGSKQSYSKRDSRDGKGKFSGNGKGKGKGKFTGKGKGKFAGKGKGGFKRDDNVSTNYRRPKHQKLDIKFDPQAKSDYLTSLSSKKKERRHFGLAMQKVKDRKAKLEMKKEEKEAMLEQIEEAENNKRAELYIEEDEDDGGSSDGEVEENQNMITTFRDEATQNQFGGDVVVTTFNVLSDDDDDSVDGDRPVRKKVDSEQVFAGSVKKYMAQFKAKSPAKKNKSHGNKAGNKGQHGASGMKGVGNAKTLNLAQKTLTKAKGQGRDNDSNKRGGKKRKGRR